MAVVIKKKSPIGDFFIDLYALNHLPCFGYLCYNHKRYLEREFIGQ